MMVNKDRAMMRLNESVNAYNSLLEELNQLWMESNDSNAKKLYDKALKLKSGFKKAAKSSCGIKLLAL